MTPHEKAAKAVYEQIQNYMCEIPAWTFIAEALASAEKNGYSDGFARGQEKKVNCVCSDKGPCGLHKPIFDDLWNQAISEAVKVADECLCPDPCRCSEILSQLEKLKK